MGFGFLSAAEQIAGFFHAVHLVPFVQSAKFPLMLSYADPDYWLAGLLQAFEAHNTCEQNRAASMPVVLISPAREQVRRRQRGAKKGEFTDLQFNIPPAAAIALLAGMTPQAPLCPCIYYAHKKNSEEFDISGLSDPELLESKAGLGRSTGHCGKC